MNLAFERWGTFKIQLPAVSVRDRLKRGVGDPVACGAASPLWRFTPTILSEHHLLLLSRSRASGVLSIHGPLINP